MSVIFLKLVQNNCSISLIFFLILSYSARESVNNCCLEEYSKDNLPIFFSTVSYIMILILPSWNQISRNSLEKPSKSNIRPTTFPRICLKRILDQNQKSRILPCLYHSRSSSISIYVFPTAAIMVHDLRRACVPFISPLLPLLLPIERL